MNHKRANNNRLMSPGEAAQMIKSDDWVDCGCFLATPITLDKELVVPVLAEKLQAR